MLQSVCDIVWLILPYNYHAHLDLKRVFRSIAMDENEEENESLKDEMRNVIEEARMILPGVQALFGFQTMAVFNTRFEELTNPCRFAYIAALGLLTLAMGLLMTPAAYNRLAERGKVSRNMINLSSTLITSGTIPLILAFAIDVYVVVVAAVDNIRLGAFGALATLCTLTSLWFLLPIVKKSMKLRHKSI
jgi:hypothetical protein